MPVARALLKVLVVCALLAPPLAAQISPGSADTTQAVPVIDAANSGTPPPGVIAAAPMATARVPDGSARLDAYVDGIVARLRREYGLPALTISVVRNDALLLAKGYGLADLASARPVVADITLFRIGSVSKTFIWTAVTMLVERGQIDLDADVNSYLKSVRVAQAFGKPVTMRHLMHHRAGFEDSIRVFSVSDDDPRTLAELLAQHQPARVFAPGMRTSYSNWGAGLAAQVVADVSGQAYDDFLQAEILNPLGMRATTFIAPAKMDEGTRANLATAYKNANGALGLQPYLQMGAYWPAGGVASTATDMARWMRFHLNGGELEGVRLMSAQAHARMWTRAYNDRPGAPDLAHGFQDRSYHGLRLICHGGATSAFYTNMVMVPELGLGIFVSQSSRQTWLSVNQLPTLIVDYIRGGSFSPELAVDPAEPDALTEMAGTYLQNARVFSSFAAVFALDSTAQISPVSADALRVSLNGETIQYRRVGAERDVFESASGTRIGFLREGGRVVALVDTSGAFTMEKVGILKNPETALVALGAAVLLSLTTLLGFWWRLGRGTTYGHGTAASMAAGASLLATLCVLGFVAAAGLLVMDITSLGSVAFAASYPRLSMFSTHYAGFVIAGAAMLLCLALLPAWKAAGWGLWRRLHYTTFALVLALTAYLLWHWRVFGAPVY